MVSDAKQSAQQTSPWLFSAPLDTVMFLGCAVVSTVLAWLLNDPAEASDGVWLFALLVVGIDVAHVWSTLFRTYFDGDTLRRQPLVYSGLPVATWAVGMLLYTISEHVFWSALAYLAVWHFIRQQVGFVAMYARQANATAKVRRLDQALASLVMLCPMVYWHSNLPRTFWWLKTDDFAVALPRWCGWAALAIETLSVLLYVLIQLSQRPLNLRARRPTWMLLAATALVWSAIYWAKTDAAFTLTNVPLHGLAYVVLLFRYSKGRAAEPGYTFAKAVLGWGPVGFVAVLLLCAYGEELLWDRLVWHEHSALFGGSSASPGETVLRLLVPLLAVPQATHYLLDGFIWKRSSEPRLAARLALTTPRAQPHSV